MCHAIDEPISLPRNRMQGRDQRATNERLLCGFPASNLPQWNWFAASQPIGQMLQQPITTITIIITAPSLNLAYNKTECTQPELSSIE